MAPTAVEIPVPSDDPKKKEEKKGEDAVKPGLKGDKKDSKEGEDLVSLESNLALRRPHSRPVVSGRFRAEGRVGNADRAVEGVYCESQITEPN